MSARPTACSAVFIALAFLAVDVRVAECRSRHGCIWYTAAPTSQIVTTAAARYEWGITSRNASWDAEKAQIKVLNPSFRWFVYNSGTDNYVDGRAGWPEHTVLQSLAAQEAWDVEEAYVHYYDDTRVVLQGDTLFIPGWGGGQASNPADARVPVYYRDLSRRLVNFSTRRAMQLNKELMLTMAFDTPFANTTVYPDGLFLDNVSSTLYNSGTILSGGHVLEIATHPVAGAPEFQSWFWNENLGPFLTALKDTLETSASWSRDRQRKMLMVNVANTWTDSYVSRDVADVLFLEFQYNPVRNFGLNAVDEAHRRDVLAASAGITSFYSAAMTRTVSGYPASFTYGQTILSNLAWYLVARTGNTLLYQQGTTAPSTAGWDSLTWRGCMDVANAQLGEPTGEPYTIAQGTDPAGNPYVVKARDYTNGLALVRPRGGWNQTIESNTAINLQLPRPFAPVDPSGTIGAHIDQVMLLNGQGTFMIDQPLAIEVSAFAVERIEGRGVLHWETSGASADHLGFHVYRSTNASPREQISESLITGSARYSFVDPAAPATETYYWLAEIVQGGTTMWHGPAILSASGNSATTVYLRQCAPNPVSTTTNIQFSTAARGPATLRIFDARGRQVASVLDATLSAGHHSVTWDGRDDLGGKLSPGVYFYQLHTLKAAATRKLLLAP